MDLGLSGKVVVGSEDTLLVGQGGSCALGSGACPWKRVHTEGPSWNWTLKGTAEKLPPLLATVITHSLSSLTQPGPTGTRAPSGPSTWDETLLGPGR